MNSIHFTVNSSFRLIITTFPRVQNNYRLVYDDCEYRSNHLLQIFSINSLFF